MRWKPQNTKHKSQPAAHTYSKFSLIFKFEGKYKIENRESSHMSQLVPTCYKLLLYHTHVKLTQ